jgi:hypothetical protein
MLKMFKSVLAILFLSIFSSCAWIIHGTKQNIDIKSNPANANIYVDYQFAGKTPRVVKLLRNDIHIIKIELNGYLPMEIELKRKVDGWFWGNFIMVGLIGFPIDIITGSMYKLTPSQIQAELKPQNVGYLYDMNNLFICLVLISDTSLKK